ncbi:hypothetical protein C8J34_12235 [Rhizobium sp. PP-F2F-G36]|nr:hypothetical protein C8J34_12235 [Rhizobium sp. PP-F2F-G36]
MRFRLWASVVIFLGSYLPLSLILLVQDYKPGSFDKAICFGFLVGSASCKLPFMNAGISVPIFMVCLICAVTTLFILTVTKTKREAKLLNVKYIPSELMSYTLPYVVSFIGVGFSEQSKFLGILIFLGWMFWITHKSGQIVLNPLLVVFGWKLYEVTVIAKSDAVEEVRWALSRSDLAANDAVKFAEMQDVLIIREWNSTIK